MSAAEPQMPGDVSETGCVCLLLRNPNGGDGDGDAPDIIRPYGRPLMDPTVAANQTGAP